MFMFGITISRLRSVGLSAEIGALMNNFVTNIYSTRISAALLV